MHSKVVDKVDWCRARLIVLCCCFQPRAQTSDSLSLACLDNGGQPSDEVSAGKLFPLVRGGGVGPARAPCADNSFVEEARAKTSGSRPAINAKSAKPAKARKPVKPAKQAMKKTKAKK